MGNIMFRKEDFLGDPLKSKALKKMLADDEISQILDKTSEQRSVIEKLKTYVHNDRYVSREEIRAALADLKYNTTDSVSFNEASLLARELGERNISRRDLAQDSSSRKNKGGLGDNQSDATKRPSMRGLPF